MTTDDDFDRQIQAYLESGPAELADHVLWAARAQLKTTRRRRPGFAWLAPWRDTQMTRNTRLLLVGGGALVVAIGAGLFGSIFARPNPGPAASAAQSAPGFSATPSAPSSSVAPGPSSSVVSARVPGWSATGGMTEARSGHTATLLSDGKVLVAGGRIGPNDDPSATSAELYDPSSGTWSTTGSMHGPLEDQTATLLQDGTVLVAGGSGIVGRDASATAELYDPVSGTWTATADMFVAGNGHTATLLSDGKVLVVGGNYGPQRANLYDPISGTWTATGGTLVTNRFYATATLLSDGRVLVVGGQLALRTRDSSAELYDPSSGLWTATGNLGQVGEEHTATLLPDGRVLVVGCGSGGGGKATASAELYDPTSRSWTAVRNMTKFHDAGCSVTLLPDGRVLVAGGAGNHGVSASAEVYDPGTGTWTSAGNMDTPRAGQTATLLPGGQVLVAGGQKVISGLFSPFASAELYDPGSGN
jgi:hypothetical protein